MLIITDILLIIIALSGLFFASIVDIKIKEVPDWLSYGLISSGLAIRLFHSIIFNDFYFFIYGLLGLGLTFLLGILLYHTKQWGGGDSKLLMGLGVIFATKPSYLPETKIPFLLVLIIIISVSGAIYGIIWSLVLIFSRFKDFKQEFKDIIKLKYSITLQITSLILALISLAIYSMIGNRLFKTALFLSSIILILYPYLYLILKSVENLNFYKQVPVEKLVEGDWLSQDIKKNNKVILHKKILEKNDIERLKLLNIKKILIKDGVPFVPPFLIGTILALILGNPLV